MPRGTKKQLVSREQRNCKGVEKYNKALKFTPKNTENYEKNLQADVEIFIAKITPNEDQIKRLRQKDCDTIEEFSKNIHELISYLQDIYDQFFQEKCIKHLITAFYNFFLDDVNNNNAIFANTWIKHPFDQRKLQKFLNKIKSLPVYAEDDILNDFLENLESFTPQLSSSKTTAMAVHDESLLQV